MSAIQQMLMAGVGVTKQFVAVGATGKISTSPDGVTWTAQTSGTATNLTGAAFGKGLYVAIGAAKYISSPDGITWTSRSTAYNGIAVCFGIGQFVAVGSSGVIQTSTDGTTWNSQTSSTGQNLRSVTSNNVDTYVACGDFGVVATSPDGVTWTNQTTGLGTNSLRSVIWSGSQFVVCGIAGILATSPTGVTWTQRSVAGTSNNLGHLAFGGTTYIVMDVSGATGNWTSTDAITWSAKTGPVWSGSPTGTGQAAYALGVFAVGEAGDPTANAITTSSAGVTWTNRTSQFGTDNVNAITYG